MMPIPTIILAILTAVLQVGCHDNSPAKTTLRNQTETQAVDWILVENGTPESIKQQIIEYSQLTRPESPRTFKVTITKVPSGGFAVTFAPKPPAYSFCNLITWLDAPPKQSGVSDSMGWFESPSSRVRFALVPDHNNTAGDTLIGASKSGSSISVYLPGLDVCEVSANTEYKDDSSLFPHNVDPSHTFEVTLDDNEKFGNPTFKLTHPKDTRW